ncbi:transcriptional regulator [Saccharothrix sp. ALI-22-I]|uniref:ArsR/SmtB family transcription factor n=1 Tax=Saccharothrix sp. ALI-22-I TaxID=1933778 RepID=UPI00097C8E45|nr:winged helix-turn-helix domain-containing protein [Saccharothrix sp. ALI-22-I]ONI91153.1 transcriptional regulator [Saccharothrix sp. ALI-22-I]
MARLVDPGNPVQDAVVALAQALADPVRLTTLQVLATEGPRTAIQLAGALGVPPPRLGNHLAKLRAGGLVTVEHAGRHAVYQVAREDLSGVLAALAHYAGNDTIAPAQRPASTVDIAHTCYDHTASLLGVRIFALLVDRRALRPSDGSSPELQLGPEPTAFLELGVDPAAVAPGRRRLATACLDRTNRVPHLGGMLGHRVLEALLTAGLVRRRGDGRELQVTELGVRRLPAVVPGFTAV